MRIIVRVCVCVGVVFMEMANRSMLRLVIYS